MRAHKLAPENTDIIFLLARVSMSQNYFEDAIPLLESGLKIAPQRADLHAALGESYFMAGKAEKAIEEFKKLIELDPSARSYAFLGLSYRHLGRFDEAKKYFQEGLKHDPRQRFLPVQPGLHRRAPGKSRRRREAIFSMRYARIQTSPKRCWNWPICESPTSNLRKRRNCCGNMSRSAAMPASGYYKLAMVERSLHQMEAAQRDLSVFQTLFERRLHRAVSLPASFRLSGQPLQPCAAGPHATGSDGIDGSRSRSIPTSRKTSICWRKRI